MYRIIVYTFVVIAYISVYALYGYCADPADEGFVYNSKGKRDPFLPLIGQERSFGTGLENIISPDDLKLEGIATGAGGKQIAIINGQMVKNRDRFGALLIKKISVKKVEISLEDKDYTLTLQEPEKDDAGNKK